MVYYRDISLMETVTFPASAEQKWRSVFLSHCTNFRPPLRALKSDMLERMSEWMPDI